MVNGNHHGHVTRYLMLPFTQSTLHRRHSEDTTDVLNNALTCEKVAAC